MSLRGELPFAIRRRELLNRPEALAPDNPRRVDRAVDASEALLAGYDHAAEHEAVAMERLETAILARLDVPNPYVARSTI